MNDEDKAYLAYLAVYIVENIAVAIERFRPHEDNYAVPQLTMEDLRELADFVASKFKVEV